MTFSQTLVAQYLQQQAEKVDGGGLTGNRINMLQNQLAGLKPGEVKTTDILVLLLRLRQICCLPGLISAVSKRIDSNSGMSYLRNQIHN